MELALSTKNLTKTFQEDRGKRFIALRDIDLEVFSGEFFVILGPSGSGKSTLLRILAGLEPSYEGSASLGKTFSLRDTSFIFQQFALFPWLTVFENIEVGLLDRERFRQNRRAIIAKELQLLGLEPFARSYPRELSGGMKQRVGIARALVSQPKIIFADEPFSQLDSFTAAELRKELLSIWEAKKVTVVMVTHLVEEALELADRIAVLTPRPGTIAKIFTNHLPRPRDKRSGALYDMEDEIYRLIKP